MDSRTEHDIILHLADREPFRPRLFVDMGLGRHDGEDCVAAGRGLVHIRLSHDSPGQQQVDIIHASRLTGVVRAIVGTENRNHRGATQSG